MGELDIFPASSALPVPLYPLLTIAGTCLLYLALYHHNIHKIIEKLFSLGLDLPLTEKTLYYLFLINFPMAFLAVVALVYNNSLAGFEISCDVDYIQIVLISGYICYVEESRQTPLRGFLFIRDLVLVVCFLGALAKIHYDGVVSYEYGIIVGVLFVVYFMFQHCDESIEVAMLKLLGLKESNMYNSQFLLTQTRKQANYLKLKNIIESNKEHISEQVQEFSEMSDRLCLRDDERKILVNFARLFLPYKNAIELEQQSQIEANIEKIRGQWVDSDAEDDSPEQQIEDHIDEDKQLQSEGKNRSGSNLMMYNRTMTDDYMAEDQAEEQLTVLGKIIKFGFYPLYYISTVQGRPRYFLDYLCVFLLLGVLFLLSNSCAYFTKITSYYSYGFVSITIALILSVPAGKYYLRISAVKDFDFINIFLQSSILKSTIFGLAITVYCLINPSATLNGSPGLLISKLINMCAYLIFGAFMLYHKFATLKTNFRFLKYLSLAVALLRLSGELTYNIVIHNSQ